MDFLLQHADAVFTALVAALGQVITIAVLRNDIGWLKSNLRHHTANDDTKFAALTQRIDNLFEGAKS